jgi:hypothetical protein
MKYTAKQHLMAARLVRQNLLRRGGTSAEADRRASTFVTLARMAARRDVENRRTRPTRAKGPGPGTIQGKSREPDLLPPEIFGTPGEFGTAQLLAHHRIAALDLSRAPRPRWPEEAPSRTAHP